MTFLLALALAAPRPATELADDTVIQSGGTDDDRSDGCPRIGPDGRCED
jgi:hypothetical protein